MSYTKGEWKLEDCPAGGKLLVRKSPQSHLQIIPTEDAHLIAAAPDMYEALKMIQNAGTDFELYKIQMDLVPGILAKAEGKQ